MEELQPQLLLSKTVLKPSPTCQLGPLVRELRLTGYTGDWEGGNSDAGGWGGARSGVQNLIKSRVRNLPKQQSNYCVDK